MCVHVSVRLCDLKEMPMLGTAYGDVACAPHPGGTEEVGQP